VTGYAYESKNKNVNRQLSQQRAESVVRYLVENHQIPLRRILTPFGYGATNPVADNTTREGRTENRRAEVRVLVNKGLTGEPGDGSKISAATEH
jgi:outer membrane protein OmpA-like peptidoglycan-associated protein